MKHEFSPFGTYSGIAVVSEVYRETEETGQRQSKESVAADGTLILEEEIDAQALPDSKKNTSYSTVEHPDEDTVIVTVIAEYTENIAVKVRG